MCPYRVIGIAGCGSSIARTETRVLEWLRRTHELQSASWPGHQPAIVTEDQAMSRRNINKITRWTFGYLRCESCSVVVVVVETTGAGVVVVVCSEVVERL